jgi:phosphonate transport system ATP-binding protein
VSSHRPGPHLRLEHASVRYPGARSQRAALKSVDLRIGSGEHVAVVGPSGAGKTTLLQVAACALRAESGRVLLDGEDPWAMGSRRRQRLRGHLFLAPQSPPLPPRQRVVTAVLAGKLPAMKLASSVRSLLYPIDIAGAHAALDSFDLADRLFDRVDRLSAGERQRVGLARALLAPARLWLVDEPLSALDPVRAARSLKTLREQACARGITLVVSLHQIEMALANFPRVIGLRDGAVSFDSPSSEVSAEQLRGLYAHEPGQLEVGDDLSEQPDPQAPVPMHWR